MRAPRPQKVNAAGPHTVRRARAREPRGRTQLERTGAQVARLDGDLAYEGELGPKARAESAAEGAFRKFWLGFAH